MWWELLKTYHNSNNTRRIKNPSQEEWMCILLRANSLYVKRLTLSAHSLHAERNQHFPGTCTLSWDSSNWSPKNMQEIQFLSPEQQKLHQQRISHLIKRKSFMTGDPETSNASPELLSTHKKTQHWRAFSVKMWSMLLVRRWHRMLHPTVFTTACTPLLCRMSSWQLSGVFPVSGLMSFVSCWF